MRRFGTRIVRLRRRSLASLALLGLAVFIGGVLLLDGSTSRFTPTARADPALDLLGWLPATDQSRRAYAVWIDQAGAPLDLSAAVDRLSFGPPPLALGRSAEWQRAVGVAASDITAWASAPGAGVTVLDGAIDGASIDARLERAGYVRNEHRSVTIWQRPASAADNRIIEGDDLRALTAIATYGHRLVIGLSVDAVRAALDAAAGRVPSLAQEPIVATVNITANLSGIMVLDQRDVAIDCGVGRGWRTSDFAEPSDRALAILYHLDEPGSAPVTSIWTEFDDAAMAEALLPVLEADWRSGYVNQAGFGGLVSNLATVSTVRQIDAYVVAELTAGRDNGWVRSGVRYLVALCEQASTLIPGDAPVRATPVASPSPVEST